MRKRIGWIFAAVTIAIIGVVGLFAILVPSFNRADGRRRITCTSNLRDIAQAMRAYAEVHGTLPPQYVEKNDHKHSWRVLLLPFLERKDLYDAYHFDEPWDGPNNRKIHVGLEMWWCPQDPSGPNTKTNYFVVTGPGTLFDGERTVTLEVIAAGDGEENTILLVEAVNTGIDWMEPRDLSIDDLRYAFDRNAGKSISSLHQEGRMKTVYVAAVDTRIVSLPESIDRKWLRALLTYNGGEKVPEDVW